MDVCIITKGKSDMLRNIKTENKKMYQKQNPYKFPPGNTRNDYKNRHDFFKN